MAHPKRKISKTRDRGLQNTVAQIATAQLLVKHIYITEPTGMKVKCITEDNVIDKPAVA
jgi:hypothetical protein